MEPVLRGQPISSVSFCIFTYFPESTRNLSDIIVNQSNSGCIIHSRVPVQSLKVNTRLFLYCTFFTGDKNHEVTIVENDFSSLKVRTMLNCIVY